MELILQEKESKKEVILYSNVAERGIDFVTTIYDSEKDLLESLNLDAEKFNVIKRFKDKNGKLEEKILTNEYNGIFTILDDKEEQEKFENDILNMDLGIAKMHISSVFSTRARYKFNSYLAKTKKPVEKLFEEVDYMLELNDRKKCSPIVLENEKEEYKKAIHNYLYDEDGKPFYCNFLGFYKVLCNENILDKNLEPVNPYIKEGISSLFREKLVKYVTNDKIEHESRSALVKLDSIKNKIGDLGKTSYDDQELHTAITESYDDIDEFETNLDILMDEQGLSDEDKIIARSEMRKKFEKKNKTI